MGQQLITFPAAVRDESIQEAVAKSSPAVITVPLSSRWVTLKTRFESADPTAGVITLAWPRPEEGQPAPQLLAGQSVSLAFRRGHRKCICITTIAGVKEGPDGKSLLVAWPEALQAVQRRAYYRAPVPEGMSVPVRLWRGGRAQRRLVAVGRWPSVVGQLADISAGGMRVDVPAAQDPQLQVGEPVGVEFTPLREVGQLCLDANFRHCLPLPNGNVALGLQFVGLESSTAGRQILIVLGQVSAEYLRRQHKLRLKGRRQQHSWRPPAPQDNERCYEATRSRG